MARFREGAANAPLGDVRSSRCASWKRLGSAGVEGPFRCTLCRGAARLPIARPAIAPSRVSLARSSSRTRVALRHVAWPNAEANRGNARRVGALLSIGAMVLACGRDSGGAAAANEPCAASATPQQSAAPGTCTASLSGDANIDAHELTLGGHVVCPTAFDVPGFCALQNSPLDVSYTSGGDRTKTAGMTFRLEADGYQTVGLAEASWLSADRSWRADCGALTVDSVDASSRITFRLHAAFSPVPTSIIADNHATGTFNLQLVCQGLPIGP